MAKLSGSNPELVGSSPAAPAIPEGGKTCPRCKEFFSFEVFGSRKKAGKFQPQPYCPECTKAYRREHYHSKPGPYKQRALHNNPKRREDSRVVIYEYLKSHPCVDCGNSDVRVLEFDHLRDKVRGVAQLMGCSKDRIMEEIEKCEVRCCNCHMIITGKRAQYWWTKLPEFASEDEANSQGPHKACVAGLSPAAGTKFAPVV